MTPMALRILHCISSVDPRKGGPIEAIRQLSEVQRAQGHVVHILTLDAPDAPWVAACPLPCHAMGPSYLGAYQYSPRWVPWLKAHAGDYDAVVVNGIWQYHAFGTWRALAGGPTPYAVYTHGMLDPWFKRTYPLKHLKKWLFWPWGDYRVLRDAAAGLFTCEDERLLARQSFWLYRCREAVVGLGTGAPPGDAASQKAAFLAAFPELVGKRILLFLGRVHEKKGADLLFKALAALRASQPERLQGVQVVMAGPHEHAYGQDMKALVARLGLADQVTWTGMVSGDIKWGAFHSAEAFILPSHQENFGIAVAEALACSLPVLISRQVNIWREIAADQAGLVDEDTQAGTERLILQWLASPPAHWQAMRQRAQVCFARRFLIDRAADALTAALHDATQRVQAMPIRA